MRPVRAAAAAAVVMALTAGGAGAHPCEHALVVSMTPVVDTVYAVADCLDCVSPTWYLYAESNGATGLQRGGTALVTGDVDPCAEPRPDLLLY